MGLFVDKGSGSGIFPDLDPGDSKRPDSDPQHWWAVFKTSIKTVGLFWYT